MIAQFNLVWIPFFIGLFFIGFINTEVLNAQNRTISGFVEDVDSGERLAYATLYDEDAVKGAVANAFGFFSLKLPAGDYTFKIDHVGYQTGTMAIHLSQDTSLVILLATQVDSLGLIEVEERSNPILSSLSSVILSPREIDEVPVVLGEPDVLKALQLLPGVQSGAEGSAGLYVRGGGPDQNMILLDGAPIYHAGHLFGFFSIFNTDAVQSVRLLKGGFPARYGGRLSSIVEIDTREGNLNELSVQGGVSLVASRITVEAPLIKQKSSFIISGRRTYLDYVFKRSLKDGSSDLGYFFYDVNAKVNYIFSPNSRLFATVYNGKDRYFKDFAETFEDSATPFTDYESEGLSWRNTSATVRFTQIAGKQLFLVVTGLISRYRLLSHREEGILENGQENINGLRYRSGIEDLGVRFDLDYLPHQNHTIKAGWSLTKHQFSPGAGYQKSGVADYEPLNQASVANAIEGAAYIEDEVRLHPRLSMNAGLHLASFGVDGENYTSLQPRISTRFVVRKGQDLTASFTRMYQNIHLLAPSGLGMPTDLWLPSTKRITPENAEQFTIGYAINSRDLNISVEGFYKSMDGLLEYLEGASFAGINRNWQDKVVQGRGRSKGIELFVQRKKGKAKGQIGYTLARTDRFFDDLNEGKAFPYRYDRRHDVSALLIYTLSERKSLSFSWVYGTGDAITAPTAWYTGTYLEEFYTYYPSRGNYRAPAYHRLDFSYTIRYKMKHGESALRFNLFNAYNRKNPFYLYSEQGTFAPEFDGRLPRIKQTSLLPVIPSVDYNFTF